MSTLAKLKELAALGVGVHISAEQLREALQDAHRAGFVAAIEWVTDNTSGKVFTDAEVLAAHDIADQYATGLLK